MSWNIDLALHYYKQQTNKNNPHSKIEPKEMTKNYHNTPLTVMTISKYRWWCNTGNMLQDSHMTDQDYWEETTQTQPFFIKNEPIIHCTCSQHYEVFSKQRLLTDNTNQTECKTVQFKPLTHEHVLSYQCLQKQP